MTQRSGIFDAAAFYEAARWRRHFHAAQGNGVASHIGNLLKPSVGPGLAITIGTGYGMVQGAYYEEDSTPNVVALSTADGTHPRIDSVILKLHVANKVVTLEKKNGIPAASPVPPTLQRDSAIWEEELARGLVNAGSGSVNALTDMRTLVPPYIVGNNMAVNGSFEHWQRGVGPFTAAGAYTADRWFIFEAGTTQLQVDKETGAGNVDLNSTASMKVVASSWNATAIMIQALEDVVAFRGKTISFSCRVKTATANAVQIAIADSIASAASVMHSGGSGFETLTVTHTVSAGATTVALWLMLQANATVYFDNAMLVVGPGPVNYAPLHPEQELARCLRYYELLGAANGNELILQGYATGTGEAFRETFPYKVTKAVMPTVTKLGTWTVVNCGQPAIDATSQVATRAVITSSAAGHSFAHNFGSGTTIEVVANP